MTEIPEEEELVQLRRIREAASDLLNAETGYDWVNKKEILAEAMRKREKAKVIEVDHIYEIESGNHLPDGIYLDITEDVPVDDAMWKALVLSGASGLTRSEVQTVLDVLLTVLRKRT